jgi:hyperosmotically inducible periplasmic protein
MRKTTRAIAFATLVGATVIGATGCSVARNQQSVGSYVDDSGITAAVKAKFAEDKTVAATAISVETLKGTVQLSGFAKSQAEKDRAAALAKSVNGVKTVKNGIVVQP